MFGYIDAAIYSHLLITNVQDVLISQNMYICFMNNFFNLKV
jgi:hypothetical protein